jgi:hypothetical protein
MFSSLWNWWHHSPALPLTHLHLVLYTRRGCHLCEDAWARLELARRRYHFNLSAVDVDTDPAPAARYGIEVPVVTVNGKVRFRGRVNGVLLDRLLDAEARRGLGRREPGSGEGSGEAAPMP